MLSIIFVGTNGLKIFWIHYDDVIMTMLASQITSLTVVYSIVYSGVDQSKHQSSASLAFVQEIHRGPVNFPHKWPVTRKMFPFDDVIMSVGEIAYIITVIYIGIPPHLLCITLQKSFKYMKVFQKWDQMIWIVLFQIYISCAG